MIVITGEEGDRTLHQVRSKLFSLDKGQWKERGTGLMKLNVNRQTGNGARLGLPSVWSSFTELTCSLAVVFFFSNAQRGGLHLAAKRHIIPWHVVYVGPTRLTLFEVQRN